MTSAEMPAEFGKDSIPAPPVEASGYIRHHGNIDYPDSVATESNPHRGISTRSFIGPMMLDETVLGGGELSKNKFDRVKRFLGKLVVPATMTAVAFQQSPLNETFRANRTFEVLAETGSPMWAGLATFGWTVPIEGVAGTTISLGLISKRDKIQPFLEKRFRKDKGSNNNTTESLEENLHVDPVVREKEKISKRASRFAVDAGVTCAIGPGMVVAKRHFEAKDRTFKKDMKTLLGFTALGATVSGAIGYLATGGIEHADKVGMKAPAEWFAENAADWKFWTAALGLGYLTKTVYSKTRQAIKNRKSVDNLQNN